MVPTDRTLFIVGIAATLRVVLTGVGEFLIHFTPTRFIDPGQFLFLGDISPQRLRIGHFLVVLASPSYLLGYWHVAEGLRPARRR
jgi:hypothetical protein